ncbi:MAG: BamA/TamA family outer membrane protein [Ginsengibacter sp.]
MKHALNKNLQSYFDKSIKLVVSIMLCFTIFPVRMQAQNSHPLIINIIDKNSTGNSANQQQLLEQTSLKQSFNSQTDCLNYISNVKSILKDKGYPAASVDSVDTDSSATHIDLFFGPKLKWISLSGDSGIAGLKKVTGLKIGTDKAVPFSAFYFDKIQQNTLDHLSKSGYPFAKVTVQQMSIVLDTMYAVLKIDKGVLYHIDSVKLNGSARINRNFLYHYLEIPKGSLYNITKLQNVNRRISELPYLQSIQSSDISMYGSGGILNLYLQPKRSSQVNFLIGFLPSSIANVPPQLTGDIKLDLKNALASGENIVVNWQQLQRKSPRLNLAYRQPFIFNSSFGVDFMFDLLKKDSSYLLINTLLGLQYFLSSVSAGKIYLQNQSSYMLEGGLDTNQVKRTKLLPQDVEFSIKNLGIEYQWRNTDYLLNPRSGSDIKINASAGLKTIKTNNDVLNLKDEAEPAFDFKNLYDSLKLKTYQLKIIFNGSHYWPIGKRSTFKTALNAAMLQSEYVFRNELFQIGGYRLLRGFNEESIFVNKYAVFTGEYRVLTGTNSFLFLFTDIGITRTRIQAEKFANTFVGTGTGVSLETKFGLLNLSYALGFRNDVSFALRNSSKIHFGYVNYF